MSTELPCNGAPRNLCQQCGFLFSIRGFRTLASTNRFRHSRLETFSDRSNCHFCRYLWSGDLVGATTIPSSFRCLRDLTEPRAGRAQRLDVRKYQNSWVVMIPCLSSTREDHRDVEYQMRSAVQSEEISCDVIFVRIESERGRLLWEFPSLCVVAAEEDPCSRITCIRPLEWTTLTVESAPWLKGLIETCQTTHAHCQPPTANPLPSRLLHVRANGSPCLTVQLRVTPEGGQTGHYAALSYCWGGPQTFSLRRGNLEELQREERDITTLPKTLADAALVTYHLGLEYLWVDAFCILQDCAEDKCREIGRMCDIYQNSYVTISAATASSVSEGFLEATGKFSGRYPSCSVSVVMADGEKEGLSPLGAITLVPEHVQNTAAYPINKRGWTYQEALLCPRQLVFGDLEPFLRCQNNYPLVKTQTCVKYFGSHLQPQLCMNGIETDRKDGIYHDRRLEFVWEKMVNEYTSRTLGFEEDRPHAVASVIDSISRTTGDECVYGVWKSCAVPCLIWAVAPVEGIEIRPILGLPSWSWMSVTSPVELDRIPYLCDIESSIHWEQGPSSKRLQVSCRVLLEDEVFNGHSLLLDYMLDLGIPTTVQFHEVRKRPLGDETLYFLVLGRLTDQRYIALLAISVGSNIYHRVGLAELRDSDRIRTRKREKINLE